MRVWAIASCSGLLALTACTANKPVSQEAPEPLNSPEDETLNAEAESDVGSRISTEVSSPETEDAAPQASGKNNTRASELLAELNQRRAQRSNLPQLQAGPSFGRRAGLPGSQASLQSNREAIQQRIRTLAQQTLDQTAGLPPVPRQSSIQVPTTPAPQAQGTPQPVRPTATPAVANRQVQVIPLQTPSDPIAALRGTAPAATPQTANPVAQPQGAENLPLWPANRQTEPTASQAAALGTQPLAQTPSFSDTSRAGSRQAGQDSPQTGLEQSRPQGIALAHQSALNGRALNLSVPETAIEADASAASSSSTAALTGEHQPDRQLAMIELDTPLSSGLAGTEDEGTAPLEDNVNSPDLNAPAEFTPEENPWDVEPQETDEDMRVSETSGMTVSAAEEDRVSPDEAPTGVNNHLSAASLLTSGERRITSVALSAGPSQLSGQNGLHRSGQSQETEPLLGEGATQVPTFQISPTEVPSTPLEPDFSSQETSLPSNRPVQASNQGVQPHGEVRSRNTAVSDSLPLFSQTQAANPSPQFREAVPAAVSAADIDLPPSSEVTFAPGPELVPVSSPGWDGRAIPVQDAVEGVDADLRSFPSEALGDENLHSRRLQNEHQRHSQAACVAVDLPKAEKRVAVQALLHSLKLEAGAELSQESINSLICDEETNELAHRIPDAATAGTPIPGRVESPTR